MSKTVTVRPARDWDEVSRGAIGAGRAFPGRKPEDPFFFDRSVSAPTLPLENTHLVLVDGDIAGQLQVYERQVTFDGTATWVGAIGNVYTIPEHRGEGLGRRLIEYSREFVHEKGYAFSILLTGAGLRGFYRQSGWAEVQYPTYDVGFEEPDGTAPGRFREFSAEAHLDRVSEIHRSAWAHVDGTVHRPKHYWREWILNPAHEIVSDPTRLLVYPESGDIAGYVAWEGEDAVRCLEVGFDGEHEREFLVACWELLQANAGGGRVVWHPPIDGLPVDELDLTVTETPNEGTMVQLHDAEVVSKLTGKPIRTTEDLVSHLSNGGFYWSPLDEF